MIKKLLFLAIFFSSFFLLSSKAFATCTLNGSQVATGTEFCQGASYTGQSCTTSLVPESCQANGTWFIGSCTSTTRCAYTSPTAVSCLASCVTTTAPHCGDSATPGGTCKAASGCVSPDSSAGKIDCTDPNICCVPGSSNPPPAPPPASSVTTGCPVCEEGFKWNYLTLKCEQIKLSDAANAPAVRDPQPPTYEICDETVFCYPGCGCDKICGANTDFAPGDLPCGDGATGNICHTAIGDINTDFTNVIQIIFTALLSLSSIVAILLIIVSAYRLLFSQGDPEKVQKAREQLTAAIVGLLFSIFAFVILQFIGLELLGLPGITPY